MSSCNNNNYSGQGKFVISLNVFDDDNPAGRDDSGLMASGNKRTLILLVCDGAVENHYNVKKLFALLNLANVGEPYRFTTDIKMIRIMLGLSGGKPTYGCPYCLARKLESTGEWTVGDNRTFGGCKEEHNKFVAAGGVKKDVSKFYNCVEAPMDIFSAEEDTWTLALYPPPVLHTVLLGGPNDLFKALRLKYSVQFAAFQKEFGFERSEGRGGQYNGVTIREILSSEKVLEYLRTWRDVPDNVRKAVVEYLRATWAVYLVSMKKEFGLGDEKIFKTFREKFLAVRKIMKVSHTVKIHIVINHMSEYMENCRTTFAWTSDEFIELLHSKLRKFQENHNFATKKKRKFGSEKHLERLLSTISHFNYENLGNISNNSIGC